MFQEQDNECVYYVGVNDFANNISYNAYLVKGEKCALIGGVPIKADLHAMKVAEETVNIDYFIDFKEDTQEQEIDLGDSVKLKVYNVNGNVAVLETKSGTLFTGELFSTFGTLNGAVLDSKADVENFVPLMFKYFATRMWDRKTDVLAMLARLKGVLVNFIAPAHGPIWHTYAMHTIDLYDRLSRQETEKGVVMLFQQGNYDDECKMEKLAYDFADADITDVHIFENGVSDENDIISAVAHLRAIILGSDLDERIVERLRGMELKNRLIVSLGNCDYSLANLHSDHIVRTITERFRLTVTKMVRE